MCTLVVSVAQLFLEDVLLYSCFIHQASRTSLMNLTGTEVSSGSQGVTTHHRVCYMCFLTTDGGQCAVSSSISLRLTQLVDS